MSAESPSREADRRARRLAQGEFLRPLVLEAGAGTGKTATLVSRVVTWALGPGWERARERADAETEDWRLAGAVVGGIHAITFTEAAAAEMAQRIGEALLEIERDAVPVGVETDLLPDDREIRAARARALGLALDQLTVRTIHAWCRGMLARFPFEAGVHPHFEVDADGEHLEATARAVVEDAIHDGADDPEAPWVVLAAEGCGPAELKDALVTLASAGIEPEALARDPFDEAALAALRDSLDRALDGFRQADRGRLAGAKRVKKQLEVLSAIDASRSLLDDPAHAGPGALPALAAALDQVWEGARSRLEDWSRGKWQQGERNALDSDTAGLEAAATALRDAIEALSGLDPEALARRLAFLAPALAELRRRMRQGGVLSFAELLLEARKLLASPAGVCAQLAGEIDLLLVDEFQDTDPVQCDVVRSLALEGPADLRPSLFLVGDPKQSIYGFRSADLRAYDEFVREVCEAGGERLRLSVNFRSVPPILEEVERLVRPVMQERFGLQPGFQPLLPSEERAKAPLFERSGRRPVEHWVTWHGEDESGDRGPAAGDAVAREALAIAADLVALHDEGGLAWSDVALLFRAGAEMETYVGALRRARIPVEIERERDYYRRREIVEASAALRCVLDPGDRLALVTFLRSPWVGVPDAALAPLFEAGLPERVAALAGPAPDALAEVARCVQRAQARTAADAPGLDQVADWPAALVPALGTLAALRAAFPLLPADRFVERCRRWLLPEVAEASRPVGDHRVRNLGRFFRVLAAGLAGGADPQALLRRLRRDLADGGPSPASGGAGGDAVQVMTIHRAKGLTFGHVYLVQHHRGTWRPRQDDPGAEAAGEAAQFRLLGVRTPGWLPIQARRRQVEQAELVRLLYVASTRPSERLVLVGKWHDPEAPPPVAAADSFAKLLVHRNGLDTERLHGLRQPEARDAADGDGVRWLRVPAPSAEGTGSEGPAEPAAPLPEAAQLEAALARRRSRVDRSLRRMARPLSGRASQGHDGTGERGAAEGPGSSPERVGATPTRRVSRQVATALGTALHRCLEEWDPAAPPTEECARHCTALPARLAGTLQGEALGRASREGAAVLRDFAAGPLAARLAEIAPHVVARELPLLCAPAAEGEGALLFESGVADLVYRDPGTSEWVVADYKSDHVDDGVSRAEKVARYAAQGRFYAEGLKEALGLPRLPRFELWFLRVGQVVVCPLEARPG